MTEAATAPKQRTLGADLERRRLEFQIGRVQQVIAALRDRERSYGADRVPKPLAAAIRDFRSEADEMRDRLEYLNRTEGPETHE